MTLQQIGALALAYILADDAPDNLSQSGVPVSRERACDARRRLWTACHEYNGTLLGVVTEHDHWMMGL